MNPLVLIKAVATFATGIGAGVIVKNAVNLVKPQSMTLLGKIAFGAGSYGIGLWVSNEVSKAVSNQIDETAESIKNAKKLVIKTQVEDEQELN